MIDDIVRLAMVEHALGRAGDRILAAIAERSGDAPVTTSRRLAGIEPHLAAEEVVRDRAGPAPGWRR